MSINPFDEEEDGLEHDWTRSKTSSSSNPFDEPSRVDFDISARRDGRNDFLTVNKGSNPFDEALDASDELSGQPAADGRRTSSQGIRPPFPQPLRSRAQLSMNPFDDRLRLYDRMDMSKGDEESLLPSSVASSSRVATKAIPSKPPRWSSRHIQTTASQLEQISTETVQSEPFRLTLAYEELPMSDTLNIMNSNSRSAEETTSSEHSRQATPETSRIQTTGTVRQASIRAPILSVGNGDLSNPSKGQVKKKEDVKIMYCVDHSDENAVIRFLVKEKGIIDYLLAISYLSTFFSVWVPSHLWLHDFELSRICTEFSSDNRYLLLASISSIFKVEKNCRALLFNLLLIRHHADGDHYILFSRGKKKEPYSIARSCSRITLDCYLP